ncbi:MAG: HNH endonuclease [Lachnospiraceae bacterium]|nr:HNH endonuclease [Lachnospiraceae bacterium]
MKPWAEAFYNSEAWHHCRASYLRKVGGLCELCMKQGKVEPAEIVHHKIVLNENNVTDPSVTLNFEHLQALCRKHHAEVHTRKRDRRYIVDEMGHVTALD